MKTRHLLMGLALSLTALSASAQRQYTDRLDRGLVAVQTAKGVYCSWRIQADEYYDVQYNLYRDGVKVNDAPLATSNYTDAAGSAASQYTVKAVVRGVEQAASNAVKTWAADHLDITPKHDASLKCTYIPNDACCADVDGDGQLEILLKYDNSQESAQLYPKNGANVNGVDTKEYSLFECLKMDGTVLWWVNCGPNMGDFQNNEQNIVGYDWDGDGKAEVVMRLLEGSTVHMADGTTYTIGADGKNGTSWTNYRIPKGASSVEWFTYYGNEFLFYCEGATGKPYQCVDFPLKRLEAGETDLNKAWGDGYGHRSNKFFYGAPYLDGQKPSIFLGRGIYTRHKFVALDVNPATHELTERWRWVNNNPGPWYGQGYHNYTIADVDWDGRDEIIWGSMVIDDNGMGLSTTGLGHGDAHHVSDLNPYVHGQEGFFCNEDEPANNYRDLTTSKIYYRMVDTNDAGRSMAGNFSNTFPGAIGYGAHDTPISTVTNNHVDGMGSTGLSQNFRIYWDGDLLEECADGVNILKYGTSGKINNFSGVYSNNGTKNTPCYQGDLFGDWREEVMMRTANNGIRIYTTTIETPWRNYSLWYDHQYRNAMVWQMCGYNQPPHVSYFLGELEGITVAPPPLTTQGREVIAAKGTIGADANGKHILVNHYADTEVTMAEGAQPWIATFNVPSVVAGTAASGCTQKDTRIDYTYYTLNVNGATFTGATRVVKQGDGTLALTDGEHTYTGLTDVWAGTLACNGQIKNSRIWLNRFAELHSAGGTFGTVQADYQAHVKPVGTVTADSLLLGFGAVVDFDMTAKSLLKLNVLTIEKKDWKNGPEYSTPVFNIQNAAELEAGKYPLAQVAKAVVGNVQDIVIEGMSGRKVSLTLEEGTLYLDVAKVRDAEDVTWTGENGNVWDLDNSKNFASSTSTFVTGDNVVFGDAAQQTTVQIRGNVSPASVTFEGSKDFTIEGEGSITGAATLTMAGTGVVSVKNTNTYTGGTFVNQGTLVPATLANADGVPYGALGGVNDAINLSNGATLRIASNMTSSQPIKVGADGELNVPGVTFIVNGSGIGKQAGVSRATLHKTGNGTLQLDATFGADTLYIDGGTVYDFGDKHFNNKTVVIGDGTLKFNNSIYSTNSDNVKFIVPEGKTATLYPDGRCDYSGTLTGGGTLNLHATWVRLYFNGNWSGFTGTINAYQDGKVGNYDPTFEFNNTYGIGKATLNIQSGCTVHTNGKSFAIGALTGSGAIDNGGAKSSSVNTLTIGGKDTNFTYSGAINGSNITKVGSGIWTVSATTVLENAGSVMVNGGTLRLSNANATASMTGKNNLRVNNGGTLGGRGVLQSVVVTSGGTLRPGVAAAETSNIGFLKSLGDINVQPGGTVCLNRNNTQDYNSKTGAPYFSSVVCGGKLTLDGTVRFTFSSSVKFTEGQKVVLFECQNITGTPTFDLQALPEGLIWDTSAVLTEGALYVRAGSGIATIESDDAPARYEIYSLSGARVATYSELAADEVVETMQADGLTPAVYLVRRVENGHATTQKVILK